MIFEYGGMSSKYSIEAENKLTAYAAMIIHFGPAAAGFIAIYSPDESRKNDSFFIAIYSPDESRKNDSWLLAYPLNKRLDEIFGGDGSFFKYLDEHQDEIKNALDTIEQLV